MFTDLQIEKLPCERLKPHFFPSIGTLTNFITISLLSVIHIYSLSFFLNTV